MKTTPKITKARNEYVLGLVKQERELMKEVAKAQDKLSTLQLEKFRVSAQIDRTLSLK